jgi:Putative lumazine-binding
MKTLKLTIAVLAFLFVGVTANAATKKITKSDVVNIYIDAIANGKTQGLDQILDNEMQFNTKRGDNITTIDKNTFLDFLSKNGSGGAPLNTSTTVIQDDDNMQKIKVDFKYDGFVRTDVLTLSHTTGWVITNVTSTTK